MYFRWLGLTALVAVVAALDLTFPAHDAVAAASALVIRRLGPSYVDQIAFAPLPAAATGNDVAEVSTKDGKLHIAGSSATAMGYALQWYLKTVVHTQTDWEDHPLVLPATLPPVNATHRLEKASKYTYYQNVCTVSYSSWTWSWAKWEAHIDWMALNGINMPLAFTGQEKVWQATFAQFNISRHGLEKFFAGAAFLAWGRMGNVRGSWGKGPLPQAFIDDQFNLQLQILGRMREFGMLPALPGFAGHVPEEIHALYPRAKVSRSPNWGSFPDQFCCVYMLDPTDPLYAAIGEAFVETQQQLYGYTSSLYQADTYNEMDPAQSDPAYLALASKAVIDSMTAADPKAVWLMQGWLFLSGYWTDERMAAYIGGVPDDKMLILDLYSDVQPLWQKSHNYFGKAWIYCVLHNFGGNLGLRGDLPTIGTAPVAARHNSNDTMVGVGLTMEGIYQNYIVYDLALSMPWTDKPVDVLQYADGFVQARYHGANPSAQQAWARLATSVYNVTLGFGGVTKNLITRRPNWHLTEPKFMPPEITYDAKDVQKALKDLLAAAPALQSSTAYRHDVVDITRQVLSDLILLHYKQLRDTFAAGKAPASTVAALADQILVLGTDLDRILATHEDFLLGRWLFDAKALGNTTELSTYYEYEARNQITRWGDGNGNAITDYASKQWAGLVGSYYLVRWRIWLSEVTAAYEAKRVVDDKAVWKAMEAFELGWQTETISYPIDAHGDTVALAKELYAKYAAPTAVWDPRQNFLPASGLM
uniref:Secreted protein n=1 Tax=Achlya hypogyna TaxID=1202772 RepID=A0A0A7CND7_ACHHY|nr:secreted protein [Achlya hypogyna]